MTLERRFQEDMHSRVRPPLPVYETQIFCKVDGNITVRKMPFTKLGPNVPFQPVTGARCCKLPYFLAMRLRGQIQRVDCGEPRSRTEKSRTKAKFTLRLRSIIKSAAERFSIILFNVKLKARRDTSEAAWRYLTVHIRHRCHNARTTGGTLHIRLMAAMMNSGVKSICTIEG